ncbi:hypothetical protein MMC25_001613 [Agyrium rufum]|nr:hypothetical protein [Agyrium rufum]
MITKRKAPGLNQPKENIWSSLLDSVATGKRLPEKRILLLGGDPELQRELIGVLGSESTWRPIDRTQEKPLVANSFALGYTYQDVLDADQEDVLARLSIYTLSEPLIPFVSLLKPLITTGTIPDTLLILVLDWSEPWNWMRQLRDWVYLLRQVVMGLEIEEKDAMERLMLDWQQRRASNVFTDGAASTIAEPAVTIPLGPGEWDEVLGLPLCVVCHNANRIDYLERERSWREEDFDLVLQYLRTVLLKHGASLIYTSDNLPNSLPSLIQSMLGVQSPLKRFNPKHNVVDRDRILIPPSWDSWGKIRILRDGFDVEGISTQWGIDIQGATSPRMRATDGHHKADSNNQATGVIASYEETFQDPKRNRPLKNSDSLKGELEVGPVHNQEFLAKQQEILERLNTEDDEEYSQREAAKAKVFKPSGVPDIADHMQPRLQNPGEISEHIGQVQFNMGGIQVDADDMLKRLKDKKREETAGVETPAPKASEGKADNEALASFFAGLMKRGGANSPRSKAL